MPTHRHVMPNGETFRNNSARRYVVAVWIKGLQVWRAEFRSDKESVALARWRHEARICDLAALVDNQTGEVIR